MMETKGKVLHMKLSFNMSAIIANNELTNSDNKLAESLKKLSSGYKINHPKDDPAGLAISRKMRAQINGLTTASGIATNGVSVIETAEGALTEIHSMVSRMKELSVQASNGTCTTADRASIQSEVTALTAEIERLAKDTEFNGKSLLDGSCDLKGYTDQANVKVDYYSDQTYAKKYILNINNTVDPAIVNLSGDFPSGATAKMDGNELTITGSDNFEIRLDVEGTMDSDVVLDITGLGAMKFQIGANEGQDLDIRIPKISLENMGIENLDMTQAETARDAMERLDDATAYVSQVRARLGAYQNRLEHTISSLDITEENMEAANSRIMDVDMAEEMSNYTKYQILSQAGVSMLAQANERPEKVLQLLQ